MSTTSDGRAIRSFRTGSSDWPPASALRVRLGERVERVVEPRSRVPDRRPGSRRARRSAAPAARIDSTMVWYPVQRQ